MHRHNESWFVAALLIFGTAGCQDDGSGEGSESETGNGLQCDVPQLFIDRCDGSVCHGGDNPAAGLDLVSPGVESRVSGIEGVCPGTLADPANPTGSLLYTKIAETPACGSPMPLGSDPLSEDEITCVRDWISGLLPPGEETTGDECPGCACDPGSEQSCYGGLDGTADVGICMSGIETCTNDGLGYGPCEGEVRPRGEDCFTDTIDEDCDGMTPACSELWSRAFGDELSQLMRSVAVDSNGNVYSAGDFEGLVSFGGDLLLADGDKSDLVIAKHDLYGNPVWSKHFGDSSNQYAAKIIVDANDDIFLLARVFGNTDFGGGPLGTEGVDDIAVAKFDSDGNHLWSAIYGSDDPDRAERIAVDAQGNLLMTGTFTTEIDLGGGVFSSKGFRDAFILKLDGQTGDHIFSEHIGGPGDDYGFGIAVDGNGDILATGRFESTLDYGQTLDSAGMRDIYVVKLDANGGLVWLEGFGGSGDDGTLDLQVHQATGDIALVGFMSGTMSFGGPDLISAGERDIFLASLDTDGGHRWSLSFGDAIDQFTSNFELNSWLTLAINDTGEIHMGGTLFGSANFDGMPLTANGDNPDVFLAIFGADGSPISSRRYGGSGTDLAMDLGLAGTDYLVLAGRTYGSALDFGTSGVVYTAGNSDGFIAKVAK